MKDRWVKCISAHGNVRGVAIDATSLVGKLAGLHGAQGVYSQGLGEAVMAALATASYCRQGERVNLNIQGSGYFRQALVDAAPDGTVRGYVIERDASKVELGKKPALGPWGAGTLSVLRTKDVEQKQPYIGTVPLVTGHLAKDMTFYWSQSEQINTAVGLGVNLSEDGKTVLQAGAFMVQAMPGASSEEVSQIEGHIHEIGSLGELLSQNSDPTVLLSQIFQSSAFMIVEERDLEFRCTCSWERVNRALTLVGAAELRAMLAQEQAAVVRCDFCTKEYTVDASMLEALIEKTGG
jgi:molecular chaperone Hsp33